MEASSLERRKKKIGAGLVGVLAAIALAGCGSGAASDGAVGSASALGEMDDKNECPVDGQRTYFLGIVRVQSFDAFAPYIQETPRVIQHYGGELLDVVQAREDLEGSWPLGAVTGVVRFPDRASFDAFYDSPEYAPLKALRQANATTSAAVLGALPVPLPARAEHDYWPNATYFFGIVQVHDFPAFAPYIAETPLVIQQYGGELLDVIQAEETLEGTWPAGAVTGVVRFPSHDAFQAFYESPEYAPLKALRQETATTDAAALAVLPTPKQARKESVCIAEP